MGYLEAFSLARRAHMKTWMIWAIVILVTLLALAAGGAGAIYGQTTPATTVATKINYQGRLTDPGGMPLDGSFSMRFQILDALSGGTLVWDSGTVSVDVDRGLFNVELAVDATYFDGQGLWLRTKVNDEWLSPRQSLLPVPYALSLRPGAQIERTESGTALRLANTATGSALMAESSNGYGVYGQSENGYAVIGTDGGSQQGKGYGGYFTSNTGIGVYGYSSATRVWQNQYAPGVYGRSLNGVGVYGLAEGDNAGVVGRSSNSHGVYGYAGGSTADSGYGGFFTSYQYRGLYARGHQNYYAGYFVNPGGSSRAGLYVDGTLYTTGGKTGYVVDVALNQGPEKLETGDVVVIVGYGDPVAGDIPVITVHKAKEEGSTGVAGVVDQPLVVPAADVDNADAVPKPAFDSARIAESTAVSGGEYLSMVTLGAFKAIKVDASFGAIRAGDLLIASSNPGFAMRADEPRVGAVIGKALDGLADGRGEIPVMVTLQ
jgi:hypothetical protein